MTQDSIESQIITSALGGPIRAPVSLDNVAVALGVRDIRWTPCRNGYTDFRSGAPVIHLSLAKTGPQMRFTFAHELAHVMLHDSEITYLLKRHGRANLMADEEKLANRVADELLLPESWVRENSRGRLTLGRLEYLANLADVSPVMLVARMASTGFDVGMLHWRQGSFSWHVIDRPGVPSCLHGHLVISEIGRRAIESLGHQESGIIVHASVSGRPVRIGGLAYRFARHVIQLIEPTRDIRFASRASIGKQIEQSHAA